MGSGPPVTINLQDSAQHLWRSAPRWWLSVIAASILTVAGICHLGYLVFGNAGSDQRLVEFMSAYSRAMRVPGPGERCEQVLAAVDELSFVDRERATSRPDSAALSEGDRCRNEIAGSEQRFAALAQAVAAAANDLKSVPAAASAFVALNDFDRSRQRFGKEAPLVAEGKAFQDQVASSGGRLDVLAQETAAYDRTHAPADALTIEGTLKQMTDLDRARASGSRAQILSAAQAADRDVQAGRAKVDGLAQAADLAKRMQSQESAGPLVAAAVAVTPFDAGVATPEQKRRLDGDLSAAQNGAWTELQQKGAAIAQGGTPADFEAAAALYGFLKDVSSNSLSGDRRALLSKGEAAADALSSSDARLRNLVDAEQIWRRRGMAGGEAVSSAYTAITPFDRSRFNDADREAWNVVGRAAAAAGGPKLGLRADTKDRMSIFVLVSDKSGKGGGVADGLSDALRRAGFQVATKRDDAALITQVTVQSVEGPAQDLSGGFMEWISTARVEVSASWAVDGSALFSDQLVEKARTRDKDAALPQALLEAVDAVVARFTRLTGG